MTDRELDERLRDIALTCAPRSTAMPACVAEFLQERGIETSYCVVQQPIPLDAVREEWHDD